MGDKNNLSIITEVTIRKFQFNLAFYIALCLDSLHIYQGTMLNFDLVSLKARVVRGVHPDLAVQLVLDVGRAAITPVLNISQPVRVRVRVTPETSQLSPSSAPQK